MKVQVLREDNPHWCLSLNHVCGFVKGRFRTCSHFQHLHPGNATPGLCFLRRNDFIHPAITRPADSLCHVYKNNRLHTQADSKVGHTLVLDLEVERNHETDSFPWPWPAYSRDTHIVAGSLPTALGRSGLSDFNPAETHKDYS